jgi:hypothetical protein
MRVIDFFAGLEGWSSGFRERGHEVFSTDYDSKFEVDLVKNVLDIKPSDFPWQPDIILASPPCETFSMMTVGRNWTMDNQPKTVKAALAQKILEKTISLIDELQPKFFIIENPRAKMRKMPQMQRFEVRTVTYCQYGMKYMKPTDLWGGFPPSLVLKPMCKNGMPCHISAPRGSRTGIQGTMSPEERALVPKELSLAVCLAAEADLAAGRYAIGRDLPGIG